MKTELKKPKRKKIRVWCPGGGKDIGFDYNHKSRSTPEEKRKVKYIRCGVCGQRFEVFNKECHDPGCVHHYVPKHKAY